MSALRLAVDRAMLSMMREYLLEQGIELTPKQLYKILYHMVQVADALSTKKVRFGINEDVDLCLDVATGMASAIVYDKEEG